MISIFAGSARFVYYIRQAVIPAAVAVKVYPNLYEIRQFDLLVRQNQLAEMGLRTVRLRGEGTAFESLRDYTPDDPYRSVNWKATARRGKPISTDYEPERSQRVILMIDVGRTMRSPIPVDDGTPLVMAKVDFVINSVLLLSYVASRTSDQVGLLVFADQVKQFIAPAPGGAHFQKLLEAMYALQSEPVEADYKQSISYLKAALQKTRLRHHVHRPQRRARFRIAARPHAATCPAAFAAAGHDSRSDSRSGSRINRRRTPTLFIVVPSPSS